MSEDASTELAMFPLGTVLFPGGVLPLHVFEPRYRRMITQCLEADRVFGVVLISRGSEVGGGDERVAVGTRARIERARVLPDGRWTVIASGVNRIEVEEWLPEEPFPNARVRERPEVAEAAEAGALGDAAGALRRVTALLSELGRGSVLELPPALPAESPLRAALGWQLCDAAPLGPLDRQRLLEDDDPGGRLRTLVDLLSGVAQDLVHLLAADAGPEES